MPQNHLIQPTGEQLLDAHTDITAPQVVQVQIDHNRGVVWVNVDGICVFRACRIEHIVVDGVPK